MHPQCPPQASHHQGDREHPPTEGGAKEDDPEGAAACRLAAEVGGRVAGEEDRGVGGAEQIGAEEAFRLGLFNKVVPHEQLTFATHEFAQMLASKPALSLALGFAGGAVLASLADTLMPEAFEHGRPWNSFATAGGFFLAFVLAGG